MTWHVERITTLATIEAAAWNALAGDSPFLRHEFLIALEHSGCVGHGTTWQPCISWFATTTSVGRRAATLY